MKNETRILGLPPGGIIMLFLASAAVEAGAATIVQSWDFSFLPGMAILHEYAQPSSLKLIPWAMACIAMSWAVFYRRRAH